MTGALLLLAVSCGATSPTGVPDAAVPEDSAVLDRALEAAVDVGTPVGFFFCSDPSSYFVEVKTTDGQDYRFKGACNLNEPRFGTAQASLTRGYSGWVGLDICAAQEGGAYITIKTQLTDFNGGSGTASWNWRSSTALDATVISGGGTVNVTRVGSIGDAIEGSYAFTSSSLVVSGSFRACHLYDFVMGPPP